MQNGFIADKEKVLVFWIEDQSSLIQRKDLTLFSPVKYERDEKDAEERFEASKDWFMRFEESRQVGT